MKILHIVGRIGMGGDTVVILNAIENLKKRNKIENWDINFLTHDIGYNKNKVDELKKKNYNIYIANGDLRKLGPVKYYKELKKIMEENGPFDIVHIHTALQSAIPVLVAKKLKIKKIICHAHTNSIQRKTNFFNSKILSSCFRYIINKYSTNRVACSSDAGDFLFKGGNYKIINNAISVEKFENVTKREIEEIREKFEISEEMTIVGQVGRFSDMKNYEYTIELAKETKNIKNIQYIFVGDGENFDKIKEIIKKEHLNIKCVGKQNNIEVWMRLFDIVLVPSLPGEGFSMVLIEAQASMCPCLVSSYVPKAADLDIGLLDYHSLEDNEYWLEKIKKLKNRDKWNNEGIKKIIEKKMSIELVADEWYEMYEEEI